MSVTGIVLLILLGVFLFIVEFLLVPGVTIAGIGGAIAIIAGIYLGYHYHGTPVGHYILGGTLVASVLSISLALRSKTWKSFMLDSTITGKSAESYDEVLKKGDHGEAITRLNPFGKVQFGDEFYEARSEGGYVDAHTPVEVTRIEGHRIIVKPTK